MEKKISKILELKLKTLICGSFPPCQRKSVFLSSVLQVLAIVGFVLFYSDTDYERTTLANIFILNMEVFTQLSACDTNKNTQ